VLGLDFSSNFVQKPHGIVLYTVYKFDYFLVRFSAIFLFVEYGMMLRLMRVTVQCYLQ